MGNYVSKIIAIAMAEVGYKEKKSNNQLDDKTANAGNANYTKYARDFDEKYPKWYNGRKQGIAWCDMFFDWCMLEAYGYDEALKLLCQPERSSGAGCSSSFRYYKSKGQTGKDPKVGAQIFFGTAENNLTHTGLVYKYDTKKVYTIEGNTSDQVAYRSYDRTATRIYGYGYPAYDEEGVDNSFGNASNSSDKPASGSGSSSNNGNSGSGSSGVSKVPSYAPDDVVYIVVKGDTLAKIAKKHGTTYQKLADYNGLGNPSVIYAGQEIHIPSSIANNAPKTEYYVVKAGDNLTKIAKAYGTAVDQIAAWNGIKNTNLIHIGQKLRVK